MKLVRRLCYLAVLNHASNPLHHALYCVVVIVGKNKGNGELVMDFSRTISHVIFRNDDSRGRLILKVVLGVWGEGVGWCEVWCVGWNVGWGGGGGMWGGGGGGGMWGGEGGRGWGGAYQSRSSYTKSSKSRYLSPLGFKISANSAFVNNDVSMDSSCRKYPDNHRLDLLTMSFCPRQCGRSIRYVWG